MESSEPRPDRITCPECGHENIPGAAFCAQCGTTLREDRDPDTEAPFDDTQTTSVYVPIGQDNVREEPPLWSPEPPRETIIDVDPGQTSAIPVEPHTGRHTDIASAGAAGLAAPPPKRESIRGFVLGTVAILLIAAVIGLYVYSAWLGDSARDTIDGWLPWAL